MLAFSCERRKLKAGETSVLGAASPRTAAISCCRAKSRCARRRKERRVARGALIGETALARRSAARRGRGAAVDASCCAFRARCSAGCLTEFPDAAAKVRASAAARARDLIGRLEAMRTRAFET